MDEAKRAALLAKRASAHKALDESVRVAVDAERALRGRDSGAGTLGVEWEDLDFVERLGQAGNRPGPKVPRKKPAVAPKAGPGPGRRRNTRP